jgi:hypothetical protein
MQAQTHCLFLFDYQVTHRGVGIVTVIFYIVLYNKHIFVFKLFTT